MKGRIAFVAVASVMLFLLYEAFNWTVNRYYVGEGQSLMLRYKGPVPYLEFWRSRTQAKQGFFAEEGEVGVLAKMRGPGRHFYCPVWYERTLVDDIVVKPGEVGIVTCKLGDSLPEGVFLVDGDIGDTKFKGILRKALGPGVYRINPYAYTVKIVQTERVDAGNGQFKESGWVNIPAGYVGVVTNLADNPLLKQKAGIQDNVLPPGLYPINGREQQVDVISIGFLESTVAVTTQNDAAGQPVRDESGEPVVSGGINFPSSDGFPIHMDYTLIWGLMPGQAPHAVKTFGGVQQVENKVVLPQIESVCRNNGSEYSAVNLLVGEHREEYQGSVLKELHGALDDKEITPLYGLVRHIYIPQQVRKPIQSAFIADELALTRAQEQTTTKVEATLREAEANVALEGGRVGFNTTRLYQEKLAEGIKTAETTKAETTKLVAAIDKQTAELNAQAKTVLAQAEQGGQQLVEEAKAGKFKLAVGAFGTPSAYNNWIFANGLPADVDLKLFYAGEGTLWTDMKNLSVMLNKPQAAPQQPQEQK